MKKKKVTKTEEGGESAPPRPSKGYGRVRGQDRRFRNGIEFGKDWIEVDTSEWDDRKWEELDNDPVIEFSETKPRNYGKDE